MLTDFNPSAALESRTEDLQRGLRKKKNDVKNFNISTINIKGTITYCKEKQTWFKEEVWKS